MSGCGECEGTGLVYPSAFAGDVVSWPAWLLRVEEIEAEGAYGPGASATRSGRTRPVACPRCGGGEEGSGGDRGQGPGDGQAGVEAGAGGGLLGGRGPLAGVEGDAFALRA